MASMTTNLTIANSGDGFRNYALDGHSATEPQMLLTKWKPAGPTGRLMVMDFHGIAAVKDAEGIVLPEREAFHLQVRRAIRAEPTDLAAKRAILMALLADLVVGDEFASATDKGFPLL